MTYITIFLIHRQYRSYRYKSLWGPATDHVKVTVNYSIDRSEDSQFNPTASGNWSWFCVNPWSRWHLPYHSAQIYQFWCTGCPRSWTARCAELTKLDQWSLPPHARWYTSLPVPLSYPPAFSFQQRIPKVNGVRKWRLNLLIVFRKGFFRFCFRRSNDWNSRSYWFNLRSIWMLFWGKTCLIIFC